MGPESGMENKICGPAQSLILQWRRQAVAKLIMDDEEPANIATHSFLELSNM